MKKSIIICGAAFMIIAAFSSCKKDYTCECSYSGGGTTLPAVTTTIHATKADAKTACNTTTTAGGVTYTCAIK